MKFKTRTASFVLVFWILCFIYGYFFAPINDQNIHSQINEISLNSNEIYQSVNSIDPTEMEVLGLETYANSDLLNESPTYSGYSSCDPIDFTNTLEVKDPYNILTILNKQNKIEYDFVPFDLVSLEKFKIETFFGKVYLRSEVAENLNNMYKDIRNLGIKIKISSGWRSLGLQQKVLNKWIKKVGTNNANNYAALPGHSEHHLGTAVDILTPENGYNVDPNYFNTKTFAWLNDNSYKYGFLLSYPKGKENITGYNPEGWHYRYVGIETAKKIHENKKILAEYLYELNGICFK